MSQLVPLGASRAFFIETALGWLAVSELAGRLAGIYIYTFAEMGCGGSKTKVEVRRCIE